MHALHAQLEYNIFSFEMSCNCSSFIVMFVHQSLFVALLFMQDSKENLKSGKISQLPLIASESNILQLIKMKLNYTGNHTSRLAVCICSCFEAETVVQLCTSYYIDSFGSTCQIQYLSLCKMMVKVEHCLAWLHLVTLTLV